MCRIDPMSPGERVVVEGAGADVATLSTAFNDMLDRLETERRESARAALSVQEAERRRIARELHDEVGQTLTAMLLQIEGLATRGSRRPSRRARGTSQRQRAPAPRTSVESPSALRPEALDELGLDSALLALVAGSPSRPGADGTADRAGSPAHPPSKSRSSTASPRRR